MIFIHVTIAINMINEIKFIQPLLKAHCNVKKKNFQLTADLIITKTFQFCRLNNVTAD